MRPPTDREHVLVRLGLAVSCGAAAVTPWLGNFTTNAERFHGAAAIVAGVLLVASVLVPKRLPELAFDPALTLAAVVLLYHGFVVVIETRYGGALRAQEVLFGIGAGAVALAEMLGFLHERREP